MSTNKFHVAIIGGGIGGLTAAIALSKRTDIQVDVYETAHKYTEIGAGVRLRRRSWHVMRALGLEEPLSQLVDVTSEDERAAFTFRMGDQTEGFTFFQLENPMGALAFHRADFLQALSTHLPTENVTSHFCKRLISYTLPPLSSPTAPIALNFKDGTTSECDVLIGADGIHSAVRGKMYRDIAAAAEARGIDEEGKRLLEMVDPKWSGSVAYRGVIPCAKLEAISPGHRAMEGGVNYMGQDKHVIVFPMVHKKLINVVAFCSEPSKEGTTFDGQSVQEVPQSELLEQYAGWEKEVTDLLKCIEKPSRWAIDTVGPLPTFNFGRVVLLGDAAHAMTPHQGSGAGQAIEDAYILSALLTSPITTFTPRSTTTTDTNGNPERQITTTLEEALKVYDAIRQPASNDVLRLSRINGLLYEFNDPRFPAALSPVPNPGLPGDDSDRGTGTGDDVEKDKERLKQMGEEIKKNWEWAWSADAEKQKDEALRMLEERVARIPGRVGVHDN
ncbi:salicylate hydroxylase [Rickenella mellea]|uniref:Salicylate hydroxylase n=1 Tax=Rickenella mellea TaxID=50990 RepID=A0A4Y7QGI9_9AGAM|nr:salicylate hydroxylase [Rickenella mellea]